MLMVSLALSIMMMMKSQHYHYHYHYHYDEYDYYDWLFCFSLFVMLLHQTFSFHGGIAYPLLPVTLAVLSFCSQLSQPSTHCASDSPDQPYRIHTCISRVPLQIESLQ